MMDSTCILTRSTNRATDFCKIVCRKFASLVSIRLPLPLSIPKIPPISINLITKPLYNMKNTMFVDLDTLKQEAKSLVDDGSNIEYTRGVLEIISSFISYGEDCCHADNAIELAKEIGLSSEVISKLY